jgi:hypothetical protein
VCVLPEHIDLLKQKATVGTAREKAKDGVFPSKCSSCKGEPKNRKQQKAYGQSEEVKP